MKFPSPEGAGGSLLLEASSFIPLAILRIGLAAILLAQAQVLWEYRELLLDEFGPVPWIISDRMLDPFLPRLSYLAAWLAPTGISSKELVAGFLIAHGIGAALLLVGYCTRWAALLAWATYVVLRTTGHLYFYGIGGVLLIGLFYCIFLPVAREWSVDRLVEARRRRPADDSLDASLSVLVLRIHLCIIYLAAGLSKAVGEQWWSGDAVWRALSLPRFQQFETTQVFAYPALLQVAALGAFIVQLAYPVLVWTRLRAAIVLLTELMHLGIAIFLGLWMFSVVMIVFNLAAFGETLWRAGRRWSGSLGLAPSWKSR